MNIELINVKLDYNDKKDQESIENLKSKTTMGLFKFPLLEISDYDSNKHEPVYMSEPLSVCKFLSRDKCGFYGPDIFERAKVD
jgi:hypothetical protein